MPRLREILFYLCEIAAAFCAFWKEVGILKVKFYPACHCNLNGSLHVPIQFIHDCSSYLRSAAQQSFIKEGRDMPVLWRSSIAELQEPLRLTEKT